MDRVLLCHMKQSIYNHFITLNGQEFVFNSLTNQFILVSKQIKETLMGNETEQTISEMLLDKGFFVNDDISERDLVQSLFFSRKHSNRIYNLIINTTLDCNLDCWYCYETHPAQSYLSLSTVNTILEHLKVKYSSEPFEVLRLSFFGGEPMLNFHAIKELLNGVNLHSEACGYKVFIAFVTNGTLLNERYAELLKPFNTRFQITIDGDEENHNSIRIYKSKAHNEGSYKKILSGLRLFNNIEAKFYFTIRINFNNSILNSIENLMRDIDFLDRKKVLISLQQIWQYNITKKDYEDLFRSIEKINQRGFVVDTFKLYPKFEACYADNYNHAVINYDGKVFKCTARDFTTTEPDGLLNSDGFIEWNINQVNSRLSAQTPQKCIECSLLPCCPGICTQKLIESTDINNIKCPFDDSISKETIILLNIKQKLISKKNESN